LKGISSPTPPVSIIIVHYRGYKILHGCIESILKTTYRNYEIVIVDNGCDDGSIQNIWREYASRIKLIHSDINLGFVKGNNLALQQITSKYVVLLNNDTQVDPNWLHILVDTAEKDSSVAAIAPKLLSLSDPKYFEYSGASGGMLDVYGVPLCRGRVFDLIEEDRGQYNSTIEIFWASGAAFFARTDVVKALGMFDELLYAHMEEIDLCWRMQLAGYKVVCNPDSTVFHLGGGTELERKFYLKQRNNLIMLLKNYSLPNLLKYFPARILLDCLSIVYFAFEGKGSNSIDVARSYLWILDNISSIARSRRQAQSCRKVPDKKICVFAKVSIAFQYYVLKRRNFFELKGLPMRMEYYFSPSVDKKISTRLGQRRHTG
jgi:GT2 family glycosyltransferase